MGRLKAVVVVAGMVFLLLRPKDQASPFLYYST